MHGIVSLLSKKFLKLVFIAAIIALAIAWWAMNKWLEDFVYRIDIGCCSAAFTEGFQAIKAAAANPVKSLRTE